MNGLLPLLANPQLAAVPLFPAWYAWWFLEYRAGLHAAPRELAGTVRGIDRVSIHDFRGLSRRREPAIIVDLVPRWKAFADWTPAYLKEKAGHKKVRVLTSSSDDRDFSVAYQSRRFEVIEFGELIDIVFASAPGPKRYYLWSTPGWSGLSPLNDDLFVPHLDNREFNERASAIWVGQADNITALHYDAVHGFLAQLRGRKQVVMFPPGEGSRLSVTSPFGETPCKTKLPKNCLDADPSRFPGVHQALRYEAILAPGEMLYIPMYWWHEVKSLDNSISVPMRFTPRWTELVHPGVLPLAFMQTLNPIRRRLQNRAPDWVDPKL